MYVVVVVACRSTRATVAQQSKEDTCTQPYSSTVASMMRAPGRTSASVVTPVVTQSPCRVSVLSIARPCTTEASSSRCRAGLCAVSELSAAVSGWAAKCL